jgi:hypothetical protein
MLVVTQLVFGAVIMTALICGTILALQGVLWVAVAMLGFSVIGLFLIGGMDVTKKTSAPSRSDA